MKKYVKANNSISVSDNMFDSLFNKALKNGVDKGVFEQPKGMSFPVYFLSLTPFADMISGPSGGTKLAKKSAAPAAAKKPAAKKATTAKKETKEKKAAAPKKAAAKKDTKEAAPKKAAPKKVIDSDDDVSMDDAPVPAPAPKRKEAPKRAARTVPKTYIDISEDEGGKSGSEFEDYD